MIVDYLVKPVVDPSGSATERKEVIVTVEAHVMVEEEEDSVFFGLGSLIVALVSPISACVYLKCLSLIALASAALCLASFWALGMMF